MSDVKVIKIDDVEYVRKDSISEMAEQLDGMDYVIIRTYSAGVFAGYLSRREGKEVELKQARRIWRWSGAATLSQLAMDGTSKPKDCKFPCAVNSIILTEVIEIIPCTDKAMKSIKEVPVWKN